MTFSQRTVSVFRTMCRSLRDNLNWLASFLFYSDLDKAWEAISKLSVLALIDWFSQQKLLIFHPANQKKKVASWLGYWRTNGSYKYILITIFLNQNLILTYLGISSFYNEKASFWKTILVNTQWQTVFSWLKFWGIVITKK